MWLIRSPLPSTPLSLLTVSHDTITCARLDMPLSLDTHSCSVGDAKLLAKGKTAALMQTECSVCVIRMPAYLIYSKI